MISSGYRASPEVFEEVKRLSKPNLLSNASFFVFDLFLIFGPSGLLILIVSNNVIFGFIYPLIAIASARGMRGLECLVHDASHHNIINVRGDSTFAKWLRKLNLGVSPQKISDFFCNLFFAIPMFSTVENYWASHSLHHKMLGTDDDPDFVRHNELGLAELDRNTPQVFVMLLISKFFPYWKSWWKAIGTDKRTTNLAVLWHLILLLILSANFGFWLALGYWTIAFFVPFVIFLPILRFIGEAGEHDYVENNNIAEKTYSNTGILHRLIIHPHNDGLHTLHHVFAQVPHHNLPKLDHFIQSNDGQNYHRFLRNRKSVFEEP